MLVTCDCVTFVLNLLVVPALWVLLGVVWDFGLMCVVMVCAVSFCGFTPSCCCLLLFWVSVLLRSSVSL